VSEAPDSAGRTYSLKDARHLLTSARSATRASNRWIPWIIAHTGARVNEITPLEKADIFELEGHWFIHIRVGNGRDTKTHKSRKVPIHRALISEGFIDFVKESPAGRLFPGGANEDQRIREWIKEKVFPTQEDMPPPNHGFRHLFEDALFAGVSQKAALYITGRSSGSSADDYGGSDLRLIEIAEQMDKVREIVDPPRNTSKK
jgi:integrase